MPDEANCLVAQKLASLTSLRHLDIEMSEDGSNIYKYFFSDHLIPLPSIQVLTIQFTQPNHDYLTHTKWNQIFPSLQIVFLDHFIFNNLCCHRGNIGRFVDEFSGQLLFKWKDVEKCVRKLIKPLKQCPNLRKVYHRLCGDDGDTKIREFVKKL